MSVSWAADGCKTVDNQSLSCYFLFKMVTAKKIFYFSITILLLLSLTLGGKKNASAQSQEPPKRQTSIEVRLTQDEWWLIRWADNQITCQIFIDHEGLPTNQEINNACDNQIYNEWVQTPPCDVANQGLRESTTCKGMYLFDVGSQTKEHTVIIDLPPATVWLNLSGCTLEPPSNFCKNLPSLLLTGQEPLPNEHIEAIHAVIGKKEYTCTSAICEIPLTPTALRGTQVEFWADSSFGDTTEHYTALVRVLDSGVTNFPTAGGWFVNVLSTQWQGVPVDSCAQIWDAFPPVGGAPFWLSNPTQEQLLATDQPFYYLAGRLIDHGVVDASDCPDGGLLPNGYANACGLDKARPMVELWQNQFDKPIIRVAQETNLPSQLLKNLFAQESQFWPGVFRVSKEFGLGQMTDLGADTILIWNPTFYEQFCPLVLESKVCAGGYLHLKADESAILRGALASNANADCPECQDGIDLTSVDASITLFAQTLKANCSQISRTVFNATNSSPGMVSNYENLWRFVLANYNAGAGCLAFAVYSTWQNHQPLEWDFVSTHFTEACQGAVDYVELIAK